MAEPDEKPAAVKVRKTSKKAVRAAKEAGTAKGQPWTFPKNTLEDSIRVAKALEDKNAGNPMPAQDLALATGFRQKSDWRFGDLVRSGNQYGILSGTAWGSVSLTDLGRDIVAPGSPTQRATALLKAFQNVQQFKAVQGHYGGKRIPEDEFFLNTLTREFSVPRERAEHFSEVFLNNLKYLGAFKPHSMAVDAPGAQPTETQTPTPPDKVPSPVLSAEPRVREFLDTCFVMMPFGNWFDRYYAEIYVPAIKEAGFEPVRADELFSSGSVVEQIWEQITKAKLLLADLTNKNANVFYELGLAHAVHQPVVFTSANVDDVPFDLRHLRVIIYDIREPDWATRLRTSVADYLKNAAKEPGKSIPHPFREKTDAENERLPTSTGRSVRRA